MRDKYWSTRSSCSTFLSYTIPLTASGSAIYSASVGLRLIYVYMLVLADITAVPSLISVTELIILPFLNEFLQLASTNAVSWSLSPCFKFIFLCFAWLRYLRACFGAMMWHTLGSCRYEASMLAATTKFALVHVATYIRLPTILQCIACWSSLNDSDSALSASLCASSGHRFARVYDGLP